MMKMNAMIRLTMCLLILGIAGNSIAQLVEEPYEVATWSGFTEAAITYTFDDNCANQYAIAIPMFNEFGFVGTFFPVINWSPNWSNFQAAAEAGHEIGSHSVSHPNFGDLSASQQDAELRNSQQTINNNISGQSCLTIAYPYCVPSIDTLTSKYYIAARHCQGYTEKTTPDDFLNISSTICGDQGSVRTLQNFKNRAATAAASSGWNVYLIHGIDNDGGYSPLSSTVLRQSLEYLDYHRDRFWVSSFVNVVRYIRERNSLSVHELEISADTIRIAVSDTLDNAIYNYPVSIRRPLPEAWTWASAYQDENPLDCSVTVTESDMFIEFDAIPDAGTVILVSSEEPDYVQVISKPFEVGTWMNFTEASVSYTFDDNCPNQYAKAIPMLNEFGFNATFFPVIDWSPNWTSFQDAADAGHEIGSHTVSHPSLDQLTPEQQDQELKDSRDEINMHITGQTCLTIAYPYCMPADDSLTAKYYIAGRHCQGYIEKTTPVDFYTISSIACGSEEHIKTTDDFIDTADAAAKCNGWSVFLIHGIDSDGGYSPLSSDVMQESLEYFDANRDRFWVSTFANAVRYIRERNSVSVIGVDVFNDSIHIIMTDTMPDDIFNIPVSIRRPLPENWPSACAFQNGDPLETHILQSGTNKYLVVNAVPDKGLITLMSAEIPEEPVESLQKSKLMPNPFIEDISILSRDPFRYTIHGLDGRLLESGKGDTRATAGSSLRSGLYLLRVQIESSDLCFKIYKI